MISSILATDMGLHFDYMKRLGWMQEKLHDGNNSTDGWNGRLLDDQRTLACSLLIKCADISNVVCSPRPLHVDPANYSRHGNSILHASGR